MRKGEAADQGLVGQWGNSSEGMRDRWDKARMEGAWGNPDPRECGKVGNSKWGDAHRVKGL